MKKYKCVIIDDEPLALEVIKSHINKLDNFEIAGAFRNALEASEILLQENIDLLFLDIQMPGMKGTDFLRSLSHPPKTILTTAFREYALEGYDLDVVDYLLKPISFERFFKAINKFLKNYNANSPLTTNESQPSPDYIYLNINKKIHKIYFSEIVYVESIKDYLTIHTLTSKMVVKHTLTALLATLPAYDFLRIHRSFVVALKQIKSFSANTVNIGPVEIPIGKNYQSELFNALNYPHHPSSES